MGMSASQARLISLEARMSDVEYEAQQINQQRLTLSNKMNEVQERVYNMEVPTPPSKQDFMYDVYTGKTRGGKPVRVTINGDGSLSIAQTKTGTIVTKGDMVKVTNGSSTEVDGQKVDLPAGYTVVKRTTGEVFRKHEDEDFGRQFKVTIPKARKQTEVITNQDTLKSLYDNGGSFGKMVALGPIETVKNEKDEITSYKSVTVETGYIEEDPGAKEDLIIYEDGKLSKDTYNTGEFAGYSLASGFSDIKKQDCLLNGTSYNVSKLSELAPNALTDTALANMQKHYGKDPQCSDKSWTWADLVTDTNTYQLRSDVTAYLITTSGSSSSEGTNGTQGAISGTTVNGNETITIAEANKRFEKDPDSTWSACYSGLKQTMGTFNKKTGEREFDESAWRVVLNKTSSGIRFSFVKTEDLALGEGAEIQEYVTAQGDYEEDPTTVNANDPNVEYDPETGHIVKVKVDGQDILLTYGQECDEIAYDKANNKYLYMKSLYDQEQNQLNKQTSIYQRQDKQLELKLTRLDTERNALNTEIDAVKKVIQDATESGFKTFSG